MYKRSSSASNIYLIKGKKLKSLKKQNSLKNSLDLYNLTRTTNNPSKNNYLKKNYSVKTLSMNKKRKKIYDTRSIFNFKNFNKIQKIDNYSKKIPIVEMMKKKTTVKSILNETKQKNNFLKKNLKIIQFLKRKENKSIIKEKSKNYFNKLFSKYKYFENRINLKKKKLKNKIKEISSFKKNIIQIKLNNEKIKNQIYRLKTKKNNFLHYKKKDKIVEKKNNKIISILKKNQNFDIIKSLILNSEKNQRDILTKSIVEFCKKKYKNSKIEEFQNILIQIKFLEKNIIE